MTKEQKEQHKKIKRRKNSDQYIWCTSLKKYLPKTAFYKNSSRTTGYQSECKVVIKARTNNVPVDVVISNLPKAEQRLYR